MEIIKDTTEAFTAWLEQVLLTVINMKTNGAMQQKHKQNYTYENSVVHETTPHLTLHGMVKIP